LIFFLSVWRGLTEGTFPRRPTAQRSSITRKQIEKGGRGRRDYVCTQSLFFDNREEFYDSRPVRGWRESRSPIVAGRNQPITSRPAWSGWTKTLALWALGSRPPLFVTRFLSRFEASTRRRRARWVCTGPRRAICLDLVCINTHRKTWLPGAGTASDFFKTLQQVRRDTTDKIIPNTRRNPMNPWSAQKSNFSPWKTRGPSRNVTELTIALKRRGEAG